MTADVAPVEDTPPPLDAPVAVDAGPPADTGNDTGPALMDSGNDTGPPPTDTGNDTGNDTGPAPCPPGRSRCGEQCVDLATSRDHCGGCSRSCTGSAQCVGATCVNVPTTRYRVETGPAEVTHLDACAAAGAMRLLVLTDDSRVRVNLPFAFRYWSTDFAAGSPVAVTSNGWASLSNTTSTLRSSSIPATLEPNATLSPYWTDLYVRGGGVCVATMGEAPNRRFVIEWRECLDVDDANTNFTFEVVLHESTHIIDMSYRSMLNATGATVGLENPTGTAAVSHCPADAGTYCRPTTGSRARYVPIP